MVKLVLYWLSAGILIYTFLGYGIVVFVWNRFRKKQPLPSGGGPVPSLAVIIPAYNEAEVLGPKIRESLSLSYPGDGMELWVVTDGSTDGSEKIVAAFPQVRGLHDPERWGKAVAINRVMEEVKTDLVVITDANAKLSPDSLLLLAAHFNDPSLGGVSGEKKVLEEGEGMYWKYESFLKRQDADLCSLVGAAGELFAFRSNLFEPLEPDTILDDFVLSLRLCLKGYRVGYEPRAMALEAGSPNTREEQKRKIRIAAGGWQAIWRLRPLLFYRKNLVLSFQYWSHRVLRWTIAPFCLPLLFLVNALLVVEGAGDWYRLSFLGQLLFYGMAFLGWLGACRNTKWPIVYILYYFVFMNWAAIRGGFRFLRNRQEARWEKSGRLTMPVK